MLTRLLGPADAPAFRAQRIRALRDHPEAFGRTPDEVDAVEVLAERFRQDADSDRDFVLGAFDGEALLGVAGCHRENAVKHRHVAYIVTTVNTGARALYASCGFRTVATRPRSLKVGDRYYDEELMVFDLV